VNGSYDAAQRRQLEQALRDGRPLRCPSCDVEVSARDVPAPREVSYVRHRVWVLCPGCRRSASLDRR
jgi:uncharacterized protein with PIN domain